LPINLNYQNPQTPGAPAVILPSKEQRTVLEFCDATVIPASAQFVPLRQVNLQLNEGDLALVRVDASRAELPLADAALGIFLPDSGTIRFAGDQWSTLSPSNQSAHRGQIGRVFHRWGWVSNLNVLENVTLAERHHSKRPTAEIEHEAHTWARRFGLKEIPVGRPTFVEPSDLQRCQWVRAMLGKPDLILLEQPLDDSLMVHHEELYQAVEQCRRRGAAVVWTTRIDRVWNRAPAPPVKRFRLQGQFLQPADARGG